MIQASSEEKTERILELLRESNLKTQLVLEYQDSDGDWQIINDLDTEKGVSWNKSAKKYKYASPTLTPKASDITFSVLNRNGQYSIGSGTDVEGIFGLNTKVRLNAGYLVDVDIQETTETIINSSGAFSGTFFQTKDDGGDLVVDGSSFDRSTKYFTDLFPNYGTVEYKDLPSYTPTGFYVYTKDFEGDKFREAIEINVTANNDKYKIYYRSVSNLESAELGQTTSTAWKYGGFTSNGTNTLSISEDYRYFQIALVPDGVGAWDSSDKITSLDFSYNTYIEYLYKDVFYLDSPSFTDPASPQMPVVNCKGRDAYKRAIEKDINIQDLSAGVTMDVLLKDVLDLVGLEYTSDSIADISTFSERVLAGGFGDTIRAEKVLEKIMQIISQDEDKYQMYMQYDSDLDNTIFYLKQKPTQYVADFVFNYKYYRGIGDYTRNYDKMLSRLTIATDQPNVDERALLDTKFITNDGDYVISWSGDNIYIDVEVAYGVGDGGDTVIKTIAQDLESITINVTGTNPSFSIMTYGCQISGSLTAVGEFSQVENLLAGQGSSSKLVNELILNDTEAGKIATEFMDDFSQPVQQINNLGYPYCHLMMETNDMTMNWARYIFNDDLSYITGIRHQWTIDQDSTTFNTDDSGLNFRDISSFKYDEENGERYDIGFVNDMGISTPLSTDQEIDDASIMTYDLEVI